VLSAGAPIRGAFIGGGVASATIVYNGAFENVSSGGQAIGTVLSGGGQFVGSGGTVISTTVSSGGYEQLSRAWPASRR